MKANMRRRDFIRAGILGGVGAVAYCGLPRFLWAAPPEGEPGFLIQVLLPGGADHSYFFDARPLAMTHAGLAQNYLGIEPALWTDASGGACWATSLVKPLEPYRQYFSILNGVHMSTDFDGHQQNMNVLFAGNPFGGESYLPHLNAGVRKPLDAVQGGSFEADLTNTGSVVPLSPDSASRLVAKIKSGGGARGGAAEAASAYLKARYAALATGLGQFSQGAARMKEGWEGIPGLASILGRVTSPDEATGNEQERFMAFILSLFREGATRSALISLQLPGTVDCHDAENARAQPKLLAGAIDAVAAVFKKLKETPFDATRSYLDVTTVVFTSEFSRTLRQAAAPIDSTGTDHNPTGNSVLIGGRGIKGGRIVGATDLRTPDEALSKARLAIDSDRIRVVGKPLDFSTLLPRADLPQVYQAEDYLTIHSVVNTVYDLFGAPKEKYRVLRRDGPPAQSLNALMS